MKKFLLVEGCDFVHYPVGGQLSFAVNFARVFGDEVAYVGVTTDTTLRIGRWCRYVIGGVEVDFFPFRCVTVNAAEKPVIPERLSNFFSILRYLRRIREKSNRVLTQAPELLFVLSLRKWQSIAYLFPGVENPLLMSRYTWARLFAPLYDPVLFAALARVHCVLASSDSAAIRAFETKAATRKMFVNIQSFPARIDRQVFVYKADARVRLKVPDDIRLFVVCGRLNGVKGWDLVLTAFCQYKVVDEGALLVFVGDGEDRKSLTEMADNLGVRGSVQLTGFVGAAQVCDWLSAADAVLVGSHKEGWSLAMVEALSCGANVVTTNVSGAGLMVLNGENGFVVCSRDPKEYADAMLHACRLPHPNPVSLEIADRYALSNLKSELMSAWHFPESMDT